MASSFTAYKRQRRIIFACLDVSTDVQVNGLSNKIVIMSDVQIRVDNGCILLTVHENIIILNKKEN